MVTCDRAWCDEKVHAKGMCRRHYQKEYTRSRAGKAARRRAYLKKKALDSKEVSHV